MRRLLLGFSLLVLFSILSEWLQLDLKVSALFFKPDVAGGQWLGEESAVVSFFYHAVPLLVAAVLIGTLLTLALCAKKGCQRNVSATAALLALSMVIGAGLIVNSLLKEHWGRPRPKQTIEFAGSQPYQPPLLIAAGNGHSFPSGHVAASFSLLALLPFYAGSARSRRLLATSVMLFGLMVGYSRIAAGGHYLTDVLWAAGIMWGVAELLAAVFHARLKTDSMQPSHPKFLAYSTLLVLVLALVLYQIVEQLA